jgi:hypothetical protein
VRRNTKLEVRMMGCERTTAKLLMALLGVAGCAVDGSTPPADQDVLDEHRATLTGDGDNGGDGDDDPERAADEEQPGDNPRPPGASGWSGSDATAIDPYVLAQSLEMVDNLDILRGERVILTRSYAELQQFEPRAGTVLTGDALVAHWQFTFQAWLHSVSSTPDQDARAVVGALSRYFVGVRELTVGPRCSPISSGYVYGFVKAGVPGDSTVSTLVAELARSDQQIAALEAELPTHCVTELAPHGGVEGTRVSIRLPQDSAQGVDDLGVWSLDAQGARVRAGVPVPAAWALDTED